MSFWGQRNNFFRLSWASGLGELDMQSYPYNHSSTDASNEPHYNGPFAL
jgi:hypothetical protein